MRSQMHEGVARIENVIKQQDMPAAHVGRQARMDVQFAAQVVAPR